MQIGRSPSHRVFRRRQVKHLREGSTVSRVYEMPTEKGHGHGACRGGDTYAALILRLLEGGWPWLWTKRICRGAEAPSDLLKAAFMAQTWPWGGPCSRDGVVALRCAKTMVDLRD